MSVRIFVGPHDRTGAVLCMTKNGVVRGKSETRQPLNDAWELRGKWCLQTSRLAVTLSVAQRWHRTELQQNHTTTNVHKRTVTDNARMSAYKDSVAETGRVKEREKEFELSEVQAMCPLNLGMRSRWRIDMRSHLAKTKRTE